MSSSLLYQPAYEAYDSIQHRKLSEEAQTAERESKRRRLDDGIEELAELPAFSSFIHIAEAKESCALLSDANTSSQTPETSNAPKKRDGFERMQRCRMALEALDNGGWKRSYHQRLFHNAYIAACARPFWKLDPPGSFARAHQKILEVNSWDSLAQEILISTPRRWEDIGSSSLLQPQFLESPKMSCVT